MRTNQTLLTCCLFVFIVSAVSAGGLRERWFGGAGADGASDSQAAVDAAPIDVPEWVQHIIDQNFAPLYPEPNRGGYIGYGVGSTAEEALAAAAVEFAANVSTEVSASVMESAVAGSDIPDSFRVQVQSEVRSQAIISGLNARTWQHPNTRLHYALYQTTVAEYEERLRRWVETMAALSEAERQRAVQRLEDERAAAERRQEEIKLEELREQVRLADRRMRADRYRTFLYGNQSARVRGIPTGYIPEGVEFAVGYRNAEEQISVDAALDIGLWHLAVFGLHAEGVRQSEEGELNGVMDARLWLQILNRAGWVTSTTLAIGGFGGVALEEGWETELGAGGFVTADILVPDFAYTQYSAYLGSDMAHARVTWYPFWRSIENRVALHAAVQAQYEWLIPTVTDATDNATYFGLGVAFQPADFLRFSVESRNVSSVRAGLSFGY